MSTNLIESLVVFFILLIVLIIPVAKAGMSAGKSISGQNQYDGKDEILKDTSLLSKIITFTIKMIILLMAIGGAITVGLPR